MNMDFDLCIKRLKESEVNAHYWHLMSKGPELYARHMALGSYYEGIVDVIDGFVECYQGKKGIVIQIPSTLELTPYDEYKEYFIDFSKYLSECIKNTNEDLDLQDHLLDASNLVNKLNYFL